MYSVSKNFICALVLFMILIGCEEPAALDTKLDPLSPNYVPTAPARVYAYPATSDAIVVGWVDKSLGEVGFQVERRVAQSAFVEVARVSANESFFYDNSPSLARGTIYNYRVRAFSVDRYGPYSNESSASLP